MGTAGPLIPHAANPSDSDRNERAARTTTRLAASAIALVMAIGSVALWVATPLAGLWVGSRVQAGTGSVGTALLAAFAAAIATAVVLALLLARLDRAYRALRDGRSALERMLVASAALAVTGFTIWFLGFAGPGPLLAPR